MRFDFILKYIPEMKIGKVNEWSRRLDWKVKKDNEKKLIKKEYIQGLVKVVVKGLEVDIVEVLRNEELLQTLFSLYLHNQ